MVNDRLREVPPVMMTRPEVTVRPRLLHLVPQPPRNPQMLRVTINRTIKVPHRQVHRPHVPNLPRLLQPVPHLLHQLHALLVRRQRVGVVPDGGVHVSEGGERRGGRLGVLALHREDELVAVGGQRLLVGALAEVGGAEVAVGAAFPRRVAQRLGDRQVLLHVADGLVQLVQRPVGGAERAEDRPAEFQRARADPVGGDSLSQLRI